MKPKLTLRDLFWLMLVVGLALAWWLDRRQDHARIGQLEKDAQLYKSHWQHQSEDLMRLSYALAKRGIEWGVNPDGRVSVKGDNLPPELPNTERYDQPAYPQMITPADLNPRPYPAN